MFRYLTISVLSAAAVMTLNAGQIQLSGSGILNNNVAGFGLTGSQLAPNVGQYIQPGTAGCAGLQYTGSLCASSTGGSSTSKGMYVQQLFAFAAGTSTVPDAATNTPNASGKISAPGLTSSDGSTVQFDLMNAPLGTSGYIGSLSGQPVDANYWRPTNTGAFDIPVGLLNVGSVSTMLNDYWGLSNANNILVSFCFTATSNGTCTAPGSLVSVQLQNGVQVRSSIVCNPSNPGSCPTTTNSANIATSLAASTVVNGVTVNTSTVYSSSYSLIPTLNPGGTANVTPWAGSNGGTVVLDAQQFIFNSAVYSGKYLSYIEISDSGSNVGWNNTTNSDRSRYALSAITVDVVTPEPSTVLLLIGGLGSLAFFGTRRRRNQE